MPCHALISIKWAICCVTMHSFSVIKVNFVKGKTMLTYVSQGMLNNCLFNFYTYKSPSSGIVTSSF